MMSLTFSLKVSKIIVNGKELGVKVVFEEKNIRNRMFDVQQVYKVRTEINGSLVVVILGGELLKLMKQSFLKINI